MAENENGAAPQIPQMKILGQFIRDMSFENILSQLRRGLRDFCIQEPFNSIRLHCSTTSTYLLTPDYVTRS